MLPLIGLIAGGAALVKAINDAPYAGSSSSSSSPGPSPEQAQKKAREAERKAELNGLLKRYGIDDAHQVSRLQMRLSSIFPHAMFGGQIQSTLAKDALQSTDWMRKQNNRASRLAKQEEQLKQLQRRMAEL